LIGFDGYGCAGAADAHSATAAAISDRANGMATSSGWARLLYQYWGRSRDVAGT
jgi:hypothetical protein